MHACMLKARACICTSMCERTQACWTSPSCPHKQTQHGQGCKPLLQQAAASVRAHLPGLEAEHAHKQSRRAHLSGLEADGLQKGAGDMGLGTEACKQPRSARCHGWSVSTTVPRVECEHLRAWRAQPPQALIGECECVV